MIANQIVWTILHAKQHWSSKTERFGWGGGGPFPKGGILRILLLNAKDYEKAATFSPALGGSAERNGGLNSLYFHLEFAAEAYSTGVRL